MRRNLGKTKKKTKRRITKAKKLRHKTNRRRKSKRNKIKGGGCETCSECLDNCFTQDDTETKEDVETLHELSQREAILQCIEEKMYRRKNVNKQNQKNNYIIYNA